MFPITTRIIIHHSSNILSIGKTNILFITFLLGHNLWNPFLDQILYSVQAFSSHLNHHHHHSLLSEEAFSLAENGFMNLTLDLLLDTSPSEFNFSYWNCLDRYLSGDEEYELEKFIARLWEPSRKQQNCKCYLNSRCVQNVDTENKNTKTLVKNNLSLWFRCYELDDLQVLNTFVDVLSSEKLLKKISDDERGQSLKICTQFDKVISLRFDLVHNRHGSKSTFEVISRLNSLLNVQLESLTIRESSIDSIPKSLLFKHLTTLNLTGNNLTEFDSNKLFLFESNAKLSHLDLSHNKLIRIDLSQFDSLKSIDLSFNNLTTLSTSQLSEEMLNLFKTLQVNQKKNFLGFNLANNPWNCDQKLKWLINIIAGIVMTNGQIFINEHQHLKSQLYQTDEPECSLPFEAKMFPFSVWKSVKENEICQKCDCYLEDKYAMVGYRYVIVNCTERNLDYLPYELPKNTKIVDFSNNQIRKFSLMQISLTSWGNVNKIILQNNSLDGTIEGIAKLPIFFLDISGNLLTEIPYYILDPVLNGNKIDKIRIGNNPFTCDCNTIKMKKWLQNNYRVILDITNVRCGYLRSELTMNESNIALHAQNERFHLREILKINNIELCPSIGSVEFFDILNCLLGLAIIFLLTKVTYDYFWQKRTGKLPKFFKLNT